MPRRACTTYRKVLDELLEGVHAEVLLHDKLAVLGVAGTDDGFVAADIAAAVLLQLVLEVVMLRNGERQPLASEALGNLHHPVTPIVGACE